ncbi:MAG: peroxiredoxin [Actinomycetota bacterium]|jgi:peroxiredoxin Q/BCP|nr:peroxiredoxin [Actinomycetota bacterium]
MARLAAGDEAPAFTLPDQDDAACSLADYAGQRVVVYFYPKDDTPGCTKEATQFSALEAAFAEAGTTVLGISPDAAASHRRFRERYGLTIRLLSDPGHETMAAYGAWGEKTMYGRTSLGVIRSTFLVGPDGRVVRSWYGVRADGHADKVLAALGEG